MSDNTEQPCAGAPRIDHVDIDGERLRVAHQSGRGTPLVICNNFVADLEVLDTFVGQLAQPVVRFDLPGVGRSAPARGMRRMPGLARLLACLLDSLGLADPVDVMGIGWGGLLAQQFARDHRLRVRRLVLVATSSGQLMFPGRLASVWRLARSTKHSLAAPNARYARLLFGGRRNDECGAIATAMARATPPTRRGQAAQLYALAGYTSLAWLHRLSVPTLVIAGDDDCLVPMVNARILAFLLPRARLAVVRGGGHWIVLERSGEVARLLDDFLAAPVARVSSEFESDF